MSKPKKTDIVKNIFNELGEQPAQKRAKDNSMNEMNDADIFPPDRLTHGLRLAPEIADAPANLIVSITDFLAGFVASQIICSMASCSVSSSTR